MGRMPVSHPKETTISVRVTAEERERMAQASRNLGFHTISDYLRHLDGTQTETATPSDPMPVPSIPVKTFFKTSLGQIYAGDSIDYLFNVSEPQSVDLIMTSPPFGLVRKKTYGNEDADRYCDWFRPFAQGFQRVLKDNGSLVIDIGGAWIPGSPTRSLYHFELLIMLVKEYGFHLCQEHYWWNPAKLPTPAEWVNVRRVRVKDAINTVWWLSKTPYPKASNRRILAPYSESMLDLLENGYQAKERPSGHVISENFSKNNGGAVPPNLLAIANTESSGQYQDFCRTNGYDIHPARFPALLPEYFIRFLTNQNDVVLDPFAGSCVTGMVAERLHRRWACVELNAGYLQGALARFKPSGETRPSRKTSKQTMKSKPVKYDVWSPCSVEVDEAEFGLVLDGGRKRAVVPSNSRQNATGPEAEGTIGQPGDVGKNDKTARVF